jgi:hypothetical protein
MVLVGKPEGDKLEDQGINGRMGSQCISGRLVQGVERIHLAQDTDWWQAFLNTVMNLQVLVPWSYFVKTR